MSLFKVGILVSMLGTSMANVLNPLGSDATEGALKWQPVLDFDKDTCYHTAAIDSSGNTNAGLEPSSSEDECRSEDRLWHCNTYARERCNHYWCAYMYGYYSEMDYDAWTGGHRHDWEHVIVWTLHDEVTYVSWSAHGDCKYIPAAIMALLRHLLTLS